MTSREHSPFSPSVDDFQRTFAPDVFQKTLHMNKTETSWSFLHARTVNADEFPTPASTEYHLPIARRPKSAGMSHLTARENQRLHVHTGQPLFPSSPKKVSTTLDISSTAKTPTDADFNRMLEKLQKLQAGNFGEKRITLAENRSEPCVLDTNEIQYLKVTTMNKLTPLKVVIRRFKGKAVVYMSKSISEPTDLVCDATFTRDSIVITDTGIRFKFDTVFFALKALEPLSASIRICFGKRRMAHSDSTPRGRFAREESEDEGRWETYKRQHEPKSLYFAVNYVRKNLVVVPPSSPNRKFETKVKKRISDERRKSAMIRRASLADEKKRRVYETLHKHELRQLEIERQAQTQIQKQRALNCQKDWVRLIRNAEFLEITWDTFVTTKRDRAIQAKQAKAATKIQANFRRFVKGADGCALALRSCRNAILLYSRHTGKYAVDEAHMNLGVVLKEAYQNFKVTSAIRRTFRRSNPHPVILTQRRWRKYVELRQERFEKLSAMWTSTLEDIIKNLTKLSRSPKRVKKKKDVIPGYLHISQELKSEVLRAHMHKCREKYSAEMRDYITSQKELTKRGVKAFLAEVGKTQVALPPAPSFVYLPSKEEMKAMIDKAAKETLKTL